MSKYVCTRWAFDLTTWTPTLQQLTQAIAAVQPEERLRLMRFHFIDDFLSSLIGRLLMRKFIAQNQSHLNYHDIKFARDIRGKPYWVKPPQHNGATATNDNLCFNVSHQGDCVVLAGISGDGDDDDDFGIGTDVMKIEYKGGRPLAEFFRLMESKFAAEEWANIKQADSIEDTQESLKAFMRHWCLKEAYVKELGVGITVDLKSICFNIDQSARLTEDNSPVTSTTLRCSRVPMLNWHFEEHLIKPEHCAAVAFKNCKPLPEKFEFLDIKEVLVESEKAEDNDIIEYCRQALQKAKKSWN